jgi:hypothetical protein
VPLLRRRDSFVQVRGAVLGVGLALADSPLPRLGAQVIARLLTLAYLINGIVMSTYLLWRELHR